jgi:hypothetical protein
LNRRLKDCKNECQYIAAYTLLAYALAIRAIALFGCNAVYAPTVKRPFYIKKVKIGILQEHGIFMKWKRGIRTILTWKGGRILIIDSNTTGAFQFGLVSGDIAGIVVAYADGKRFDFTWDWYDESNPVCGSSFGLE